MWLDSSRAYISELEVRGVLSPVKGRRPLRVSVLSYIEYLRKRQDEEQTPRSEAAARHHELKAQLAQYQIERYERRHITMEEHDHFTDMMVGKFRVHASSWAAKVAGTDMVLRHKVDGLVYAMRKDLADEAEKNDKRRA